MMPLKHADAVVGEGPLAFERRERRPEETVEAEDDQEAADGGAHRRRRHQVQQFDAERDADQATDHERQQALGLERAAQLPHAAQPGEQHPARAAGQPLGQRDELLAPAIDRAEVAGEGRRQGVGDGAAVAADAGEIKLVQQRRVERRRFVALQPVDRLDRRGRGIERRQLRGDRVRRFSAPP